VAHGHHPDESGLFGFIWLAIALIVFASFVQTCWEMMWR
jgi:hypothetical protein